jgi:hypothetical protein
MALTHPVEPRSARHTLRGRAGALLAAAALAAGLTAAVRAPVHADGTPTPGSPAFQATQVDAAVVAAESTASARAMASAAAVTVDAETDTGTLVVANPDGSFTRTQSSSPVRVRQNGAWVSIDPTLSLQADGSVRPRATATAVAFSGGGTGPMVALSQGASSLSFTFPSVLPAPTIAGATAAYANVLPGVDLQLTADATGFSELLVVNTSAAAANPVLRTLTLATNATGVTVAGDGGGGAVATDAAGNTVFHADVATMWDSAGGGGPVPLSSGSGTPGAHIAQVAVSAGSTTEAITPDQSLLTASTTRYPVYIDPAWHGNPSQLHWARISSNGWNVYDTNSTAGGDHPRVGVDNWPYGAGETARTYYQMNTGGSSGTSGIGGATVTSATMSINEDWAADSTARPVDVFLTARPNSNRWDSSHLNWSNKPGDGTRQDEQSGYESGGTVHPGTLQFNITNAAQAAAGGNWPDMTFDVRVPDEGDPFGRGKLEWKQLSSGGGAGLSITYFRAPYLSGVYTTSPTTTDAGATFATSHTVTMNAPGGDTDGENVRNGYEIWTWTNGTNTAPAWGALFSPYSATGGPYTYSGLADGTYAWRGVTESVTGGLWSGWSPWQVFTVDTTAPNPPGVESAQFPQKQYGAAFGSAGTFTFTTDGTDNVKGYLFSLDGDLGTTVYNPASPPPTWPASGGTPAGGRVYWVNADNGNGTGAEVVNGFASARITPGGVGPHRLYAKAVDRAGNTSAETTDLFYAGLTTPAYVYGDQLVNGYTAADGTVVPAATWSTGGGASLTAQADCCGVHWADGKQAFLTNGTGAVAVGDTATMHFEVPATGYWDLGANLTIARDYGQYTLTLDAGTAGAYALTPTPFDAYNTPNVTTTYRDLGVPRDATGAAVQLAKGNHALTLRVTGQNAGSIGRLAGIDVLRLAPMSATCPINDLTACLNNTAISIDSTSPYSGVDADGGGNGLSSTDLSAAGWRPGTAVTVNGAPMTAPTYAANAADNITAAGQLVTIPGSGVANDASAVVLVGFAVNGNVTGLTGTITYAGVCNLGSATQQYTIDTVPDWIAGPATAAALQLPDEVVPGSTHRNTGGLPKLFAVSIPLTCPGLPVSSISLPVVSNGVSAGVPALHILGIGLRPVAFVGATATSGGYPNSQMWTGTFGARQDTIGAALPAATVRMPVRVTIGDTSSTSQVRVRLSNVLGTAPVTIDDASVAVQSAGPVPVATPSQLSFNGGGRSITIPAGGEAVTDPLTYPVAQQSTLLVSLHLSAAVASPPAHGAAQSTAYVTAAGTDAVLDATGTPFTAAGSSTIGNQPYLTGVDITTPTAGALVLAGDHTINADTSGGDGSRLTDQIATQLAALPANGGTVPYGILNAGQNNWNTSSGVVPAITNSTTPGNAIDPADRVILDQTNARTVLVSTGTDDLLAGTDATTLENRLIGMASQVRSYYTDAYASPSATLSNARGLITVYVATIPPDARFTPAEEAVRETVNNYILCGANSPAAGACTGITANHLGGASDGAIDFAAAVSAAGTDTSPTVAAGNLWNGSPDNAYYAALASRYVTDSANASNVQPMFARKTR